MSVPFEVTPLITSVPGQVPVPLKQFVPVSLP